MDNNGSTYTKEIFHVATTLMMTRKISW